MKIAFAVNNYPPAIGGSAYYIQQLAEECVGRGHDVTVLTESQHGEAGKVHVRCSPEHVQDKDLVVVHGCDMSVQKYIILNYEHINSKLLLLPIEPSYSREVFRAAQNIHAVGCSTIEDWEWAYAAGVYQKAYSITHGINKDTNIGVRGIFKDKFAIPQDKKMFLSCGGYYENKQMNELVDAFWLADVPDTVLVTTGYCRFDNIPSDSDNVFNLYVEDPNDIKNALADSDCYIMNSSNEGFGMVILEAMINRTPWIGRNIAGARLLSDFGTTYSTKEELVGILRGTVDDSMVDVGYDHVVRNHLVSHTVDSILSVI
jgi:glycosyltransferase involved in cell wall biosynthesis